MLTADDTLQLLRTVCFVPWLVCFLWFAGSATRFQIGRARSGDAMWADRWAVAVVLFAWGIRSITTAPPAYGLDYTALVGLHIMTGSYGASLAFRRWRDHGWGW